MTHDWAFTDAHRGAGEYMCRRCGHFYTGKFAPRNDLPISVDDERNPDGSLLLRNCDDMVILKVHES